MHFDLCADSEFGGLEIAQHSGCAVIDLQVISAWVEFMGVLLGQLRAVASSQAARELEALPDYRETGTLCFKTLEGSIPVGQSVPRSGRCISQSLAHSYPCVDC